MALRVYEGSRIMLDIYNVLDAISEIVYVSDAETHEILYINEAGKKILGDCLGETCYKLFHGKSAECTNCPSAEYTYDSCIRYGVPSDNAGKSIYY